MHEIEPVHQSILAEIPRRGAMTVCGIANTIGRSRGFCHAALERLVAKTHLKELVLRDRRYYLVPNKPFLDCQCDGRCKEQIVALSDPRHRALHHHLDRHGPMRFHEFASSLDAFMVSSERTLHRWLNRLLDTGLVQRRGASGDLRSTIYEALRPTAPAAAMLEGFSLEE